MQRIFIFFAVFFLMSPGSAQLMEQATSAEDVAVIFYKLANTQPDIDQLAQNTIASQTSISEGKKDVIESEKTRLRQKFETMDTGHIIIRTAVTGEAKMLDKAGLSIKFPGEGPIFFPYTYGGENFGLIVHNIDAINFIPMRYLEAEYAQMKLAESNQIYIVMRVKPKSVNAKDTFEAYGQNFLPLLTDVDSISLYNNHLEAIWSWTDQG